MHCVGSLISISGLSLMLPQDQFHSILYAIYLKAWSKRRVRTWNIPRGSLSTPPLEGTDLPQAFARPALCMGNVSY